MSEKDKAQNIVRVKVDGTGVDIAIGAGLPKLLGRLIPTRFHIRRSVDQVITRTILEKMADNGELDDAELAFAESVVSDYALKFIRLKRIESRSRVLSEEAKFSQVPLLRQGDDPQPSTAASETSDDWINKFREDASLVDDELVQEIYARVLAEEAQRPESFSLRTLGVLRYLDKQTATAFGDLQRVIIDNMIIPPEKVLTTCGLDYPTMLTLADAGLVNFGSTSRYTSETEGGALILNCSGNGRLVAIRPASEGGQAKVTLQGHVLTPAGQQLARIAESESNEEIFRLTVEWIRSHVLAENQIFVAALPSRHWRGNPHELEWELLQSSSQ